MEWVLVEYTLTFSILQSHTMRRYGQFHFRHLAALEPFLLLVKLQFQNFLSTHVNELGVIHLRET